MRRLTLIFGLLGMVITACGASSDVDQLADAASGAIPATAAATRSLTARTSTRLGLVKVATVDSPVYVTAPPGDLSRLFVVSQKGQVFIVKDGRRLDLPFLDVSSQVACCGEQGLLSIAFAPDYLTSGLFYIDYTDRVGRTRIVEYKTSSFNRDRAISSSARLVISQVQPEANHNGGQLQFGPDRLLYIGLGDGGGGGDRHGVYGNGQNLSTLLGKILRINPRASAGNPYSIPASNPFIGRSGARAEIYSYGLRNPWRFSFDSKTGDLTIGDVGESRFEEIDFALRGDARGANYGWRVFEGVAVNADGESALGAVEPVLVYAHGSRGCSIAGGYVARDPALTTLLGRYIYGDFCSPGLRSVKLGPSGASDDRRVGLRVSMLVSFGQDGRGRLYAVSLGGSVYRLVVR